MLTVVALQCIELMGEGCLNNEHFEELGGILKGKLEEHFKNQELRQAKRQDEDYDEGMEETLQDEVSVPHDGTSEHFSELLDAK